MDLLNKITSHLPTYLNPESKKKLFKELKSFPNNIDSRIYTENKTLSDSILYQGDIINEQPLIFFPKLNVTKKRVFIISNTCDMDLNNNRPTTPQVSYCPIIDLKAYKNMVEKSAYYSNHIKLESHLESIRNQRVTTMFYLPEKGSCSESVVLFDFVQTIRLDKKQLENMLNNRVLKLGDYGFYLFLVKFSIHFTRIEEGVNRG